MVSQVNWEDDIIWSLEDVKPNLQAQARAGWIPTQTTRTAHSYAMQQEQLLKQLGIKSLNNLIGDILITEHMHIWIKSHSEISLSWEHEVQISVFV